MSTSVINATIRDCLTHCYYSPAPLFRLAVYLNRLLDTGKWTNEEVAAVRSATVRILRSVKKRE